MLNVKERFFADRASLQRALLANTEFQIEKSIQQHGNASLMLSGGSTPKPLYQSLAASKLHWSRISIGMVDERWVDENHEASNEQFIRLNLLNRVNQPARFCRMKTQHATPFDAVSTVERHYTEIKSPYTLTVLGMGTDGHTASLFPHAKGLDYAINHAYSNCAAIEAIPSEVTGDFTQRMTLTLNAIKNSQLIKLVITGQEKYEVYRKALQGNDVFEMPIRSVLKQNQSPVVVYWAP